MTLEELCVKFELAARMAKLGWPQEESLFVWGKNTKLTVNKDKWFLTQYRANCLIYIAAPTAPGILERLPEGVIYYKANGQFFCQFPITRMTFRQPLDSKYHSESDETSLANAAGKYWCWWKEKEVM